jgi:hypothetical protein
VHTHIEKYGPRRGSGEGQEKAVKKGIYKKERYGIM